MRGSCPRGAIRARPAGMEFREPGKPRPDMAVVEYQDLPLADRDRRWDADDAEKRVREWAGAEDEPNEAYRKAFVWYDETAPDRFSSYKLPIADVIGGTLMAVPRAVIAAAAVV